MSIKTFPENCDLLNSCDTIMFAVSLYIFHIPLWCLNRLCDFVISVFRRIFNRRQFLSRDDFVWIKEKKSNNKKLEDHSHSNKQRFSIWNILACRSETSIYYVIVTKRFLPKIKFNKYAGKTNKWFHLWKRILFISANRQIMHYHRIDYYKQNRK